MSCSNLFRGPGEDIIKYIRLIVRARFSCERGENAEAGICAGPPGSPSPQKLNNSRSCSLMRRDIVEQFPGDICGESLGMPPPPRSTHAHFSSSSRPGRCCRQGPPKGEIKRSCCCLLAGEMDACFSLFFLCHTCRKKGGKTSMWRKRKKKRKPQCMLWRSSTPPITAPILLQHQPHPQPPPVESKREKEERIEGGRGHVIRRACGHSFTPRQNERGPAVSLLHD